MALSRRVQSSGHEEPKRPHNRSASASSSSSVRSLHAIDVVDEDLNRSEKSRATGYMGKNSEVSWMQRLDSQASKWNDEKDSSHGLVHQQLPIDGSIASMNYHLDYQTVTNADVNDAIILPPKALADHLFQVYFDKVHISLPFLRRDLFIDQYRQCFSGRQIRPGGKWLAILNLIFAIGSAYCRLSGQIIRQEHDETLFFGTGQKA
ncbi:hypothetical protein N7540_013134 [Penicillium herquei]|nr:hypothetical protein N7540_013134 [Penicillium herquei]